MITYPAGLWHSQLSCVPLMWCCVRVTVQAPNSIIGYKSGLHAQG